MELKRIKKRKKSFNLGKEPSLSNRTDGILRDKGFIPSFRWAGFTMT